MEWFVDSFRGCLHKSFVTMPSKFGKIWTWFDPSNIEFLTRRGLKNKVFASGWDFTYHRSNRRVEHGASVQPVSRLFCVRDFNLAFWLPRCTSNYMHRINRRYCGACCFAHSTDVKIFHNVGLTGAQLFSFWRSSVQLHRRCIWILSDHPVLYHWLNRRCSNRGIGLTGDCFSSLQALCHRLDRRTHLLCVGSTGDMYLAVSCTVSSLLASTSVHLGS